VRLGGVLKVLDLRVQGYAFEMIGKHLGVSKGRRHEILIRAFAEITVIHLDVDRVRAHEPTLT
jgi:hypothetical protein